MNLPVTLGFQDNKRSQDFKTFGEIRVTADPKGFFYGIKSRLIRTVCKTGTRRFESFLSHKLKDTSFCPLGKAEILESEDSGKLASWYGFDAVNTQGGQENVSKRPHFLLTFLSPLFYDIKPSIGRMVYALNHTQMGGTRIERVSLPPFSNGFYQGDPSASFLIAKAKQNILVPAGHGAEAPINTISTYALVGALLSSNFRPLKKQTFSRVIDQLVTLTGVTLSVVRDYYNDSGFLRFPTV